MGVSIMVCVTELFSGHKRGVAVKIINDQQTN